MFEHLSGGLMRTLISYSDLLMLPPSILGWGSRNPAKGLKKKNLLKMTCLAFTAQGDEGFWGGSNYRGPPKPKILVITLRWENFFFPLFTGDGKSCCWAFSHTNSCEVSEENIWIWGDFFCTLNKYIYIYIYLNKYIKYIYYILYIKIINININNRIYNK